MNTYFTSDTHFGHTNVIKYSNRPYADKNEMDETIIMNWNARVQPEDTIYHLGDFAFADEKRILSIIKRLNGHKHYLTGNHDKIIKRCAQAQSLFETFSNYKEIYIQDPTIIGGKQMIVMCHYPMITWNKAHHGSFMLHGHCHGNLRYPSPARIMDVGVDPQGYFPVSYEQVKAHMAKVTPVHLDHHQED